MPPSARSFGGNPKGTILSTSSPSGADNVRGQGSATLRRSQPTVGTGKRAETLLRQGRIDNTIGYHSSLPPTRTVQRVGRNKECTSTFVPSGHARPGLVWLPDNAVKTGTDSLAGPSFPRHAHRCQPSGMGRRVERSPPCTRSPRAEPASGAHQPVGADYGTVVSRTLPRLSHAPRYLDLTGVRFMVTVGAVNHMASRSATLMQELHSLHRLCLA